MTFDKEQLYKDIKELESLPRDVSVKMEITEKQKQLEEVLNKEKINNSESVSKFMNDYIEFLKNISFNDFVSSILNDHSVFIKEQVEYYAINTHMKERYNSSDFDKTKKHQKLEEIREKVKDIPYEEKVKLYCSRLKDDNNIHSMKK